MNYFEPKDGDFQKLTEQLVNQSKTSAALKNTVFQQSNLAQSTAAVQNNLQESIRELRSENRKWQTPAASIPNGAENYRALELNIPPSKVAQVAASSRPNAFDQGFARDQGATSGLKATGSFPKQVTIKSSRTTYQASPNLSLRSILTSANTTSNNEGKLSSTFNSARTNTTANISSSSSKPSSTPSFASRITSSVRRTPAQTAHALHQSSTTAAQRAHALHINAPSQPSASTPQTPRPMTNSERAQEIYRLNGITEKDLWQKLWGVIVITAALSGIVYGFLDSLSGLHVSWPLYIFCYLFLLLPVSLFMYRNIKVPPQKTPTNQPSNKPPFK